MIPVCIASHERYQLVQGDNVFREAEVDGLRETYWWLMGWEVYVGRVQVAHVNEELT